MTEETIKSFLVDPVAKMEVKKQMNLFFIYFILFYFSSRMVSAFGNNIVC